MNQQTTIAPGAAAAAASTSTESTPESVSEVPAARARRRLGGWSPTNADESNAATVADAEAAVGESPEDVAADGATVPLAHGNEGAPVSETPIQTVDLNKDQPSSVAPSKDDQPISGEQTIDLGKPAATVDLKGKQRADEEVGQTIPLSASGKAAADDGATVPLAATPPEKPKGTAPSPRAERAESTDQTMPIVATASTADLVRSVRLRDSQFNAGDPTVPLATDNHATVPLENGSQQTTEIGQDETSETLDALRQRVTSNPRDPDALFALAVALHRHGKRTEAREALTKLVEIYQEQGQHAHAKRIMAMLHSPKTEGSSKPVAPTEPAAKAATPTVPLTTRTQTLPLQALPTAQLARQAHGQSGLLTQTPTTGFLPESLSFTIPLPGEDRLPVEIREIIDQSAADLQERRLQAAFDLCIYSMGLVPDYVPLHLRIAEIYAAQRLRRRARIQAETMLRLSEATDESQYLWMIYRVLLHTSDSDLPSLRRLVELLIEVGQTDQASFYAAKLIQFLDAEGLAEEALAYSVRLCELIPGDTRAALENAILLLKNGDRGGAVDRWEAAVAAGADPLIARASMAALMPAIHEEDHWKLLAEVLPTLRERNDREIVDAYIRTAAVEPPTKTLQTGEGLLLSAVGDDRARALLAAAAGDRSGSAFARAVSAICLTDFLKESGSTDEYVAAIRTALQLLDLPAVASNPNWAGLIGRIPRYDDLGLELGEALLARQDAAGAVEVLKVAHNRSRHHGPLSNRLADAYFRIGQLGSALTVLDEMAVHYRNSGQLEAMAGVLRQMSQLAPNNIKVKSRLIDAYLQRGFVAEARAELVQRADLEERTGLIKDALASLQRAADLSWTMGAPEETFALYGRMINLAPDDAGNRHYLVNLYLQLGRLDEAAEHQRAVVDIAMKNDSKHEAIAALHQVIGLTPDDTSAYYQLGDLLSSIGEYHQAERVYRRLVMMNPDDAIAQAKATTMAALKETAVTGK